MRNIAEVTLSAYNAWQDTGTVSAEDANEILNLVNSTESMTNRDWYLGLPMETEDLIQTAQFTIAVLEASEKEKDEAHKGMVPLLTCLSMFSWELGMNDEAKGALEIALDLDPTYSLAQLAQKMYHAEWKPEALTKMRDELHPQIRKELLNS